MKIWFKPYLAHSNSHVRMAGAAYTCHEEWDKACWLVAPWNLHTSTFPTLHSKHLPVAAAVLRLQGYEVEIES